MFLYGVLLAILPILALAQVPQYPPAFPPTPILPSAINYAPSVTPNVLDPSAPNAQNECPGYKASNVKETTSGLTADLTIAGKECNVYGNDVRDLILSVQYQSQQRLAVRIYPKYLGPNNQSLYILSEQLTPQPKTEHGSNKKNSDLKFTWSNTPSFQFQVSRASSGEVLFDTGGQVLVFEDQFLELATSMVPDYNIYGLAENLHSFRLGNNYTQTFWNAYNLDNDQELDVNGHSTHPMYLETRYGNASSLSHGVYARNAHGQDWLLRSQSLTYRTIGGSFDFYFLSGPTPKAVISQYQTGIVRTPVMQPYWALGFHQDVIDAYAAADIQLEGIWNDLDYLKLNRDFTLSPHYPEAEGQEFLRKLHAAGQYYMPILDPNIYVPDPGNSTDAYSPYNRGVELNAFVRNGNDSYYYGVEWPGFSVWPDFNVPQGQQFWTEQFVEFQKTIQFDGFWLDVSDPTSWCTGSCGQGQLSLNPIHVPFPLPGDPNTDLAVDYRYPEAFNVTNATEAASASAAMASQSSMYPTPTVTPTPTVGRTIPTPGVRNITFPPYAINNFLPGHSLLKQVIAPNATHNDGPYNSTEYELHNLYGHTSANATYNALAATFPGKRPFFIARSTFAGSGNFTGHWVSPCQSYCGDKGGDSNSKWGNMYFGIIQALQFSIAGIPYFGVETCGFNGNADMELCTRWMQLSAWYPLYRNHNNRNTIAQEAYRWATTAEATRRVMNIRYTLLPYQYTLFFHANQAGSTVFRALAWEFPDDPQLKAVETQFMLGPSLLVTPVLVPLATTVQGVFPGVSSGVKWYDWYTLQQVQVAPGENKTLAAPLEHINVHVKGGSILPLQKAGNTTSTSRKSPWSLLIALDKTGSAEGDLYLDDGLSLVQNATKVVQFNFANNTLHAVVSGSYNDGIPLANVTIAGIQTSPKSVSVSAERRTGKAGQIVFDKGANALYISNLQSATTRGAWSGNLSVILNYS
ncbi:MAG: hypothetical protein M1821_006582 [Bathelium mastoideum]|nr:MAG: hypothetical protein M1821_006582 [Bathelium mastoideum]